MEIAFDRLNAMVKSWLITKFLPDFSGVKKLEWETSIGLNMRRVEYKNVPLTFVYDVIKVKNLEQPKPIGANQEKSKSRIGCVVS